MEGAAQRRRWRLPPNTYREQSACQAGGGAVAHKSAPDALDVDVDVDRFESDVELIISE